jgi:flavin-dependent dehydrogenase
MRTVLPSGRVTETKGPGFTIRRDLFDLAVARMAEKAGAEILTSTTALSKTNGEVLIRIKNGGTTRVKSEVIIGADGPLSAVGRWIGCVNRDLIPAVQVRVPLVRSMDVTEVYFDRECYAGYGWLFPKGSHANVGVGRKRRRGDSVPIGESLKRLVIRLTERGKIHGTPLARFGGWIPAAPLNRTARGNVMLVGDAAGQTHPITGAGVSQAVLCGQMAGKWAARICETGDFNLIDKYEEEWRSLYGPTLERGHKRRQLLEREWDRLEEILPYCWVAYREYYARAE